VLLLTPQYRQLRTLNQGGTTREWRKIIQRQVLESNLSSTVRIVFGFSVVYVCSAVWWILKDMLEEMYVFIFIYICVIECLPNHCQP
jgi:hypothetical protein